MLGVVPGGGIRQQEPCRGRESPPHLSYLGAGSVSGTRQKDTLNPKTCLDTLVEAPAKASSARTLAVRYIITLALPRGTSSHCRSSVIHIEHYDPKPPLLRLAKPWKSFLIVSHKESIQKVPHKCSGPRLPRKQYKFSYECSRRAPA